MGERNREGTLDWLRGIITETPLKGPPVLCWVRRAPQGIRNPGKSLGVFPSSFNPPTIAHRVLIERARNVAPMDETLLILDRRALDKEISGALLDERLLMILLCFEKDPTVSVAFTNRGRFVEKLALIKRAYPDETRIRFIVGYDTLVRVLAARYYKDREASLRQLFAGSQFLVATRGSAGFAEIKAFMSKIENRPFSQKIIPFEIPFPIRQLSSTHVRSRISRGNDVDTLVPAEVLSYLRERGLYRGDTNQE
jgi:nicotinate (nicotinamide) nucleotide adenylyltransferase